MLIRPVCKLLKNVEQSELPMEAHCIGLDKQWTTFIVLSIRLQSANENLCSVSLKKLSDVNWKRQNVRQ